MDATAQADTSMALDRFGLVLGWYKRPTPTVPNELQSASPPLMLQERHAATGSAIKTGPAGPRQIVVHGVGIR